MAESVKIKSIKLHSKSPYIITINNQYQLIGATARAYSDVLFSKKIIGVPALIDWRHSGDGAMLIESIRLPKDKMVMLGAVINTYA